MIDRNQLGRRNLSPDQMSLLRGRRYNRLKKKPGGAIPGSCKKYGITPTTTADRLAEEHGVHPRTIHDDAKFASAIEQLKPTVPDIERKVIAGELTRKAVRGSLVDPDGPADVDSSAKRAAQVLEAPGRP